MASVSYRLSTVDQSSPQTYIRCCYTFRVDPKENVGGVVRALTTSTQRAVIDYPILGGTVVDKSSPGVAMPPDVFSSIPERNRRLTTNVQYRRPPPLQARRETIGSNTFAVLDSSDEDEDVETSGRVEVQVKDGTPIQPFIKHWTPKECPTSYDEFAAQGMPATAFFAQTLAPDLAQGHQPVFAVHGNFIQGGVFVVISLHHSVADVHGLAAVVRAMSNDKSPISQVSLQADAQEQSRIRDRLSGSRGVKASHNFKHAGFNTSNSTTTPTPLGCSILTFDLGRLAEATQLVNARSALDVGQPFAKVTPFELLIALLWKAVTRARRLRVEEAEKKAAKGLGPAPNEQSKLKFEVDMRKRMDPPLENYIGNACFPASVEALASRLNLPFDVGTFRTASHAVHSMLAATTETQLRATIAAINEMSDLRSIKKDTNPSESDVVVNDWSCLPTQGEATLGLGLGDAGYLRTVSSDQPSPGCTIMPQIHGSWEVVVQYDTEIIAHLSSEEVGVPFVLSAV